jgi:pyruvate formate lyase activating enzyme
MCEIKISRRSFLRAVGSLFLILGSGSRSARAGKGTRTLLERQLGNEDKIQTNTFTGATPTLREAMYYDPLPNEAVRCTLCFRSCIIPGGERGTCRNRLNRGGRLYSIVHSRPSALQIDPIEKEPQYHMLPGTYILCFGTAGCNFRCLFCHNWHLSQRPLEELEYFIDLNPEAAVDEAQKKGIPTLSFTYNEPTSFFEYVYDIAVIAKKRGLNILWHSNGALNPKPLKNLLQMSDAVTIDLKGFTQSFYRKYSSAELKPVLKSLEIIKSSGTWLEIVNLVIPNANDDPDDIRSMCKWIRSSLGTEVPLHFSRFFPAYKLTNVPPTPIETLERAYRIAREEGIEYVTLGNVPGHRLNSTFCSSCEEVLIRRIHFHVIENNIRDGKCAHCGRTIPGIWSS